AGLRVADRSNNLLCICKNLYAFGSFEVANVDSVACFELGNINFKKFRKVTRQAAHFYFPCGVLENAAVAYALCGAYNLDGNVGPEFGVAFDPVEIDVGSPVLENIMLVVLYEDVDCFLAEFESNDL